MGRATSIFTRVDVKSPAVDAVRVDVLDWVRLAGRRIDLIDRQRVLAAGNDRFPVDLPAADIAGLGERLLAIRRLGREGVAGNPEHVELVLALERDIDPGLGGMKIEVARPKTVAAAGFD